MRCLIGVLALSGAVQMFSGCSRAPTTPASGEPKAAAAEAEHVSHGHQNKGDWPLPPLSTLHVPKPWVPTWGDDKTPVDPPDMGKETWRVFVEQSEPLQKKTPHWQRVPADRAVELVMPKGSHFRCLVQPVSAEPRTNDFGSSLKGWTLSRDLYCTSDDWASWQIYPQRDFLAASGERESKLLTQANLRERGRDGKTIETVVITRSDEEKRAATKGPPRILAGVAVDDD